jgi:hypothetical protein
MRTAIVSPNARETPNETAEIIPGLACRISTFRMASQGVVPRERAASCNSWGTILKTSISIFRINGIIITDNTSDAERILYPEVVTLKSGAICFDTRGTIINIPHTPKMTEGIPASMSITGRIILKTNRGAKYTKCMADKMHIGAANTIDTKVIANELTIKGANPKFPFSGCQSLDTSKCNNLSDSINPVDFTSKPAASKNGSKITSPILNNIHLSAKKLFVILSLDLNDTPFDVFL